MSWNKQSGLSQTNGLRAVMTWSQRLKQLRQKRGHMTKRRTRYENARSGKLFAVFADVIGSFGSCSRVNRAISASSDCGMASQLQTHQAGVRLGRVLLLLVCRACRFLVDRRPSHASRETVLLGSSPADTVVAATGLDDLLEFVVHQSVQRVGERDGVEVASCRVRVQSLVS